MKRYIFLIIALIIVLIFLYISYNNQSHHTTRYSAPPPHSTTSELLPNSSLSPGVIATSDWNDICNKSLSKSRNVSGAEKAQVYREYNLTPETGKCTLIAESGTMKGKPAGCEVDHIIPLEDGGANDIKNLWVQSYGGDWNAHWKDKLENRVHSLICQKMISSDDIYKIQRRLADDWISFYREQYPD